MISKISLKNFIHFQEFTWDNVGKLNVIIGENDTGKTNFLKLLYAVSRAWSIFTNNKKNNRDISFDQSLADKLFNTFQPRFGGIGSLASKSTKEKMESYIRYLQDTGNNKQDISFKLSRESKKVMDCNNFSIAPCADENFNSIFIPPKEVLTALDAILSTRREDAWMYGFDDTYTDLINLLLIPTKKGRLQREFVDVTGGLEKLFNGKISQTREYTNEKFLFSRKDNRKYSMAMTAEGIKKLGIYTTLINNRQLHPGTVLFLDEPEAVLHPRATRLLGEMLYRFSKIGVQVFVSTHCYFLLKQLELIARKENHEIQCCALKNTNEGVCAEFTDLQEGMPDNPIVDVALQLFDDEVEIV